MQPLHERLQFDTAAGQVLDGPRRYVLLRVDVLAGLFAGLTGLERETALRAFGRSVETRGADSLRAYAAEPGVDHDALQRVVESAAASLGWGRWRIERRADALELEVCNSPFASAASASAGHACAAIAGMLQGLAAIVLGGAATAHETSCACVDGGETCRFAAHLNSPSPAHSPAPAHLLETSA